MRRFATKKLLSVAVCMAMGAVVCFGCGSPEPIESYTVPKKTLVDKLTGAKPPPARRPMTGGGPAPVFIVGAIVPHKTTCWFFKLAVGADVPLEQVVASAIEPSDLFFQSLVFPADESEPPSWTLPPGWRQSAGRNGVYATIHTGQGPHLPVMTVTPLSIAGKDDIDGYIRVNVDRWRGQISVRPEEVIVNTYKMPLKGATATMVKMLRADLVPSEDPAPVESDMTYDTPEGWKRGRQDAFSQVAFAVGDGDERVRVTASMMRVNSGLLANVNRWRVQQLGLPRIDEELLREQVKKIEIDKLSGDYVAMIGSRETILAVVLERGESVWFLKLKGDNALAKREQKHFEQFVRSIKFSKPNGAGDGK